MCPRSSVIERPWRSLKYEAVYLREIADGPDAERVVGSWIAFYNELRPHSALGGRTPGEVYRGALGEARERAGDHARRERHGTRRVNPLRGSSASLRPFG